MLSGCPSGCSILVSVVPLSNMVISHGDGTVCCNGLNRVSVANFSDRAGSQRSILVYFNTQLFNTSRLYTNISLHSVQPYVKTHFVAFRQTTGTFCLS